MTALEVSGSYTPGAFTGTTRNIAAFRDAGVNKLLIKPDSLISSTPIFSTGSINSGASLTATSNIFLGSGNFLRFSSSTAFQAPLDGRLAISNNAVNDFERLQFGGTTSEFAALQTASTNAQTGLAAIFTNGSADIGTATNDYTVGDVVQFTTTGALPIGFSVNNYYFVIATNLTTTNIQVSATSGGSAITAGSAGSGTHTVFRQNNFTFTVSNPLLTTRFAHGFRVGDIVTIGAGNRPSGFSGITDYFVLTAPSTTTLTLSATLGGSVLTPSTTGTAPFVLNRPTAIYTRSANNTSVISLHTGNILVSGTATITANITAPTLTLQTSPNSANNIAFTPLGAGILRLADGGSSFFNRLLFSGSATSNGPALQTALLISRTAIFTNASSTITISLISPPLNVGDIVTFTNSGGTLPSSISLNTEYYVVGTPTATTIQIATSFGGTAIVHNGAGTGTHTVTRAVAIYTRNGDNTAYIPIATGKHSFDATNTASGTTGAQTINKPAGTVNFAAGATSLVVTNSLVSSSSIVVAVVRTNDLTAYVKNVVPANGFFTITLEPAPTAEVSVGFVVFN
jgi:hypothetical protein